MDRAAIMAMLALLVEKAYDGLRFDFGMFRDDYEDLWELDGLVEFDDPVGNLRIDQLRAKFGDPKRYLTPPAE